MAGHTLSLSQFEPSCKALHFDTDNAKRMRQAAEQKAICVELVYGPNWQTALHLAKRTCLTERLCDSP